MCGIAGLRSFDSSLPDELDVCRLNEALAHRGPDGSGKVLLDNGRLQLGHTRLAILDLSPAGVQPMSYREGRFHITFNGEIYNFVELRLELKRLGHTFATDTDTEVLLASFAQWGEACQFKLNGMWAFAIWDSLEKTLFLSRDRFGVKPLFYYQTSGFFVFASELKAFMYLPDGFKPSFNYSYIKAFSNIESTEITFLNGVFNLNGGHSLLVDHHGSVSRRNWWVTKDHLVEVPISYAEQVDAFKSIFLDSCRIRTRSDVPIGTSLSGGLDSSSVICGLSHNRRAGDLDRGGREALSWQHAFVMDYKGTQHSERVYAERVVKHVGATPHFLELNAEEINIEDLESSIVALEAIQEPGLGPYLLYRHMRSKGVVVSLDGHGGDELLAGYHHYLPYAFRDSLSRRKGDGDFADIKTAHSRFFQTDSLPEGMIAEHAPSSKWALFLRIHLNILVSSVKDRIRRYPIAYSFIRSIRRRFGVTNVEPVKSQSPRDRRYVKVLSLNDLETFDFLNNALYKDFHFGTLPRILRNFDRLSMANGVEVRAPFLDYRLVSYAFSLPSTAKIGQGYSKRLLRDSMRGVIPEEIRTRTGKLGFASPMVALIRGGLKVYILDSIHSQDFLDSELWDGPEIRARITDAYRNRKEELVYEYWRYLQGNILLKSFSQLGSKIV